MLRIGLTGGIASGKSTVADLFAARGATVLDTDLIAREVVVPGQPCARGAGRRAGRRHPGRRGTARPRGTAAPGLFADAATRREVEAILHPEIVSRARAPGAQARRALPGLRHPAAGREPGSRRLVDRVLVVDCPEEEQIRRLMARDGEGAGGRPAHARTPRRPASSAWRPPTTSSTTAGRPPTCRPRWPTSTANTATWPANH